MPETQKPRFPVTTEGDWDANPRLEDRYNAWIEVEVDLDNLALEHGPEAPGAAQPQALYDGIRTAEPNFLGTLWERSKHAMIEMAKTMDLTLDDALIWEMLCANFGLEGMPTPTN